jgi:hypothetical protein
MVHWDYIKSSDDGATCKGSKNFLKVSCWNGNTLLSNSGFAKERSLSPSHRRWN